MSSYTVQLRWLVEQYVKDKLALMANPPVKAEEYSVADETQWPLAWKSLGLDSYPIYDSGHRQELNAMIIRRYMFREIGVETPGQFAFRMNWKMQEIMPYYNKLYQMLADMGNPLDEIDMRYTKDDTTDTEGHTDSNVRDSSDSEGTSVFSNTPQSMIEGGLDAIKRGRYATNVTYDDSHAAGTSDTDVDSTGRSVLDSDSTEKGRRHSVMELMAEYKDGIMNVDQRVVDELNDLFMLVY